MISATEQFGHITASIRKANIEAARSTARLSSGDRITRAGDDVANLSIATKLQTRITSLRQAFVNTAQADSLLQVMDGSLSEIETILQRMNALTVMATSGTLTSSERGFLDQEFQNLHSEIDRISETTNFGGVTLLNSQVATNKAELDGQSGKQYEATLRFTTNWAANNRYISLGTFDTAPINERFTWRNNVNTGVRAYNIQNDPTLEGKVRNLVEFWNDPTSIAQTDSRFNGINMELVGDTTIKITSRSRGELTQLFAIGDLRSHSNVRNSMEVDGTAFSRNGASTLFDYYLKESTVGSNTGIQAGSTTVVGQTNGSLITQIAQEKAELRLRISQDVGGINNNQRIRLDNLFTGLGANFRFRTNAAANPNFFIQIGADNRETLANAVEFFNTVNIDDVQLYNNSSAFKYIDIERDGLDLVFRSKTHTTPVDLQGVQLRVEETTTAGTFFGSDGSDINGNDTLTGGLDSGINVDGIADGDFVGTIEGFTASYLGENSVRAQVTVGNSIYRATIFDTTPSAPTRVRFISDTNEGYFDIDLSTNSNWIVRSQEDADLYAMALNKDFANLTFYQERTLANFQQVGGLQGAEIKIKDSNFNQEFLFEDVRVIANSENQDGNAMLQIDMNGDTYQSVTLIDRGFDATATYRLRSMNDPNKEIIFTNGSTFHSVNSREEADLFEETLKRALPMAEFESGGAISFQLGQDSDSQINVDLVDSRTSNIFNDAILDILSVDAAKLSQEAVRDAIDTVTSLRAEVGSNQTRLRFAGQNIQNAIVNQDAARAAIADTDISFESLQRALNLVQFSASIAALSQSNSLKTTIFDDVFDPATQIFTSQ